MITAALAAGSLLLAACQGDDEPDLAELAEAEQPSPTPTADPAPQETEEPEPDDPYAVPDEIDEAYVERVINAILEVQDEVLRGALEQEPGTSLEPELVELHFATTDGAERMQGLEELQGYIDDPDTRGGLLPVDQLGSTTAEVEYLHHVEPESCILLIAYWDRTPISSTAPAREDSLTAFSLGRIDGSQERSAGNPTPWAMVDQRGVDASLSREDYGDLPWVDGLDHHCQDLEGEVP
jgi:hypothetical protein